MTTLTDNKVETLKRRVQKGNEYCNDLWQQARQVADEPVEFEEIMIQLDIWTVRLRELVAMLRTMDYQECCFGSCRWDEEKFVCFGCTKTEG